MWLITSDLHLTDKPEDDYRWRIFDELHSAIEHYDVTLVWILGDITDAKDRHSAQLVNRICKELKRLADRVPVYIIRGNHDCIDAGTPFFAFVDDFGRRMPVKFFVNPEFIHFPRFKVAVLPHARDVSAEWPDAETIKAEGVKYALCHATFKGCRSESGIRLDGLDTQFFVEAGIPVAISGDIHVPQDIGRLTYVGAPYHCRYGDSFDARMMLVDPVEGTRRSLPLRIMKKHTLEITEPDEVLDEVYRDSVDLREGDQAKVRLALQAEDYLLWPKLRQQVVDNFAKIGVRLYSVEVIPPAEDLKSKDTDIEEVVLDDVGILKAFVDKEGVNEEVAAIGLEIINE